MALSELAIEMINEAQNNVGAASNTSAQLQVRDNGYRISRYNNAFKRTLRLRPWRFSLLDVEEYESVNLAMSRDRDYRYTYKLVIPAGTELINIVRIGGSLNRDVLALLNDPRYIADISDIRPSHTKGSFSFDGEFVHTDYELQSGTISKIQINRPIEAFPEPLREVIKAIMSRDFARSIKDFGYDKIQDYKKEVEDVSLLAINQVKFWTPPENSNPEFDEWVDDMITSSTAGAGSYISGRL